MKMNEPGRQKEERMKSLAAGVVCKAIALVYSRFEKRVDLTALDLLQRGLYIFPLWCSIAGGRGERERERAREIIDWQTWPMRPHIPRSGVWCLY